MKVEERLLDDASVDSAQRKHGELSAEVQALADENQQFQQEIRELKTRVEDLTLDCQRYEEENEDLKRTIVVLRSKLDDARKQRKAPMTAVIRKASVFCHTAQLP